MTAGYTMIVAKVKSKQKTRPAVVPSRPDNEISFLVTRETQLDPDLARIIDAWPSLSPVVPPAARTGRKRLSF
jgi:hypothetical protein